MGFGSYEVDVHHITGPLQKICKIWWWFATAALTSRTCIKRLPELALSMKTRSKRGQEFNKKTVETTLRVRSTVHNKNKEENKRQSH